MNSRPEPSPAGFAPESSARPASPAEESRVLRALLEYQTALEAGRPPDREAFLARHADIAAELAQALRGLDLVHAGARQLQQPAPAAPPDTVPLGVPLGDYQILREVGRGGMGVVYEAVQLSLGRRVALKVLPFAAALDPRQLQRFKLEAQAAALLHHPNVVPIHVVGCERGVHFYVMQYVEGRSLAALIQEQRRLRQGEPAAPAQGGPASTQAVAALSTEPAPGGRDFCCTACSPWSRPSRPMTARSCGGKSPTRSRGRCDNGTRPSPKTWRRSSTRQWPKTRPSATSRLRGWPTTCAASSKTGRSWPAGRRGGTGCANGRGATAGR